MNVPGREQKEASGSDDSRQSAAARKARAREERYRKIQTVGLGVFLGVLGIALFALLISVWPAAEKASQQPPTDEDQAPGGGGEQAEPTVEMSFLGVAELDVTGGTALLILVAVLGGLGSFIHAGTSFVEYVGNEKLGRSWTWWYVLRVPIGASLALILYVAFRGGLFSTSATSGVVNIYGVGALAALAGLFSKQATNKLEDVFSALFRVPEGKGDDRLKDGLGNPKPIVTTTEPLRLSELAEGTETTLVVRGTGFVEKAQVRLRRVATNEVLAARSTYVNETELDVTLSAKDLAEAVRRGPLEVVVVNPEPGGGESDPKLVDVDPLLPDAAGDGNGADGTTGPTTTPPPPTDTELPPTDTELPPTDTELPPTDTELPPTDTELPPETEPDAHAEATAAEEFGERPPPPPAAETPPADEPPPRGG